MTSSQPLLLDRVSEALCRAADPGQVFQALLLTAAGFGDATLIVAEAAADGQLAVRAAHGADAERFQQRVLSGSASLAGWCWQTRQPLVSQNLALDPRASAVESGCGGGGLLVPIRVAGKVGPLLAVYSRAPLTEPDESLALLNTAGRLAGLALERLHLRRSQERQVRHLLALHEVSRMLASSLEDQVALELAVDVAISLFDLDLCAVLLRQPDGYLRVEVARGIPPEVAASIRLLAEPAPAADFLAQIGFPAVAALPMAGRTNPMGYLVAGRRAAALDPEETQMLSIWTNLTGTALENTHLWEGILAKRQHFLETLVEAGAMEHGADPALAARLSSLTGAVARRLGWNEPEVRELEQLSLLCYLYRLAHHAKAVGANSPLMLVISRLSQIPLRLTTAPAVRACYQASLAGTAPPWSEMDRETQVILAVEFFLMQEQAESTQGRENQLAALLATKAQAGHRFDPAVIEALEAVVWARFSLDSPATARPAPPAQPSALRAPAPLPTPPAYRPDRETAPSSLDHLTERELEILQFVARGLSNKEIAAQLFLSEATVKTHVHRILHKLGLPDRTKAAVYLLQRRGGMA